ncbi:D-alanyl-D-alanine carboxypeptidase/D-alanyl-D-alanine-endopeptidase [Bacteroidota bacterium]
MSLYKIYFLNSVCFLLISSSIYAQLNKQIDKLIEDLPGSTIASIFIFDPTNNDTIYAKDINKLIIPASNIKLLTTATALSILGKNYKLTTNLLTNDANIEDGVVNGNLYLKGFGNPTFSSEDLDEFINTLRSLGIKEVRGNIIADDSYFDTNFSHGTVYINGQTSLSVPPVSALSFERNTIFLSLISGEKDGEKLDYTYTPSYPFITMDMNARVTKFKSNPRVSYRFDGNRINIRVLGGMYAKLNRINYLLYIENPSLYCALVLDEKLKKAGIITASEPNSGRTPINAEMIDEAAVTVADLIYEINKNSDNFYAESLFKTIGAEYSNEVGNSFYASQAIIKFIKERNISDDPVNISDGSGISRSNSLTANLIVNLLSYIYKDKNLFTDYHNSLSIAGIDGTLQDRMTGTSAQNNFHGKTGTIYGISTISGYLNTSDDRTLVLSILMSFSEYGNYYHQSVQDKIIELLCK